MVPSAVHPAFGHTRAAFLLHPRTQSLYTAMPNEEREGGPYMSKISVRILRARKMEILGDNKGKITLRRLINEGGCMYVKESVGEREKV